MVPSHIEQVASLLKNRGSLQGVSHCQIYLSLFFLRLMDIRRHCSRLSQQHSPSCGLEGIGVSPIHPIGGHGCVGLLGQLGGVDVS